MTKQELEALPLNTEVVWIHPMDDIYRGRVVSRPDLNYDYPHYVIVWDDGLYTDSQDAEKLENVAVVADIYPEAPK